MDKSEALSKSKRFSETRGCIDEKNWIKCLKNLDAKTINYYYYNPHHYFSNERFLPVIGEEFYPVKSYEAFKTGTFNSGINILAGVTADEGSTFVSKWFDEIDSDPSNLNKNIKTYLLEELDWKNLESIENRKKVAEYYISDETEVNMIKNKTGQIFGDYAISCPTYYIIRDMVLWSEENKVFMYKLNYKSKISISNLFADNQSWIGVGHGDDIGFVLGASLLSPEKYSQQDYQFTLLVMNLWSNFAKTG